MDMKAQRARTQAVIDYNRDRPDEVERLMGVYSQVFAFTVGTPEFEVMAEFYDREMITKRIEEIYAEKLKRILEG